MNVLLWILFSFGIFFIGFSLIVKTKNIAPSILFKVIPFFGGCLNVVVALHHLEIITIL